MCLCKRNALTVGLICTCLVLGPVGPPASTIGQLMGPTGPSSSVSAITMPPLTPNMVTGAVYGFPGQPIRVAVHEPDKRRY
jgi:hypothetical protein